MLAVLVNIALSAALGASVAWAGQKTVGQYPWYRLPSLWSLVLLVALVYTPAGAFLLQRYPDWSLLYLVDAAQLPLPPPLLSLLYPLFAVGAFAIGNRLIAHGRRLAVLALFAGSLAAAGLVILLAREPLAWVGATGAYRDDPTRLRSLWGSSLWYALVAANAAVGVAWLATLWRLWLLGRTAIKGVIEVAPTQLRGEASAPAPGNGKRRARSANSRG